VKALVVLTQPPLAEGGAPGRTAIGLLRGLMGHGIDVQAIAGRRAFSVRGDVPADLPVEVVDVEPPGAFRARLQRLTRPLGELTGPFSERVRAMAADADLVHLEETETVWCDEGISKPSLVHLHYLCRAARPELRSAVEQAVPGGARRHAPRRRPCRHRHVVASSRFVASALGQ
jgi:hypothetical protein